MKVTLSLIRIVVHLLIWQSFQCSISLLKRPKIQTNRAI